MSKISKNYVTEYSINIRLEKYEAWSSVGEHRNEMCFLLFFLRGFEPWNLGSISCCSLIFPCLRTLYFNLPGYSASNGKVIGCNMNWTECGWWLLWSVLRYHPSSCLVIMRNATECSVCVCVCERERERERFVPVTTQRTLGFRILYYDAAKYRMWR